MKIRGVQHDPLTDIANIRTTLKGYGSGFPIIKELIQNAEDAFASFIHIGWHPGFPTLNHVHPLLKGPALCMINDGPFEDKHEQAICRMGLGTKSADEQAIGRFGLGLKSVFHLCEAFFFMASELHKGDTIRLVELFNPWYDVHHSEWKLDDNQIQSLLHDSVKGILPKEGRPWFSIWIPLRRKVICGSVVPIINEWPGDKDAPTEIITDMFREELSDILPLLKYLESIRYLVWENEQWNPCCSLIIEPNSDRRKFPEHVNSRWSLKGSIETKFHSKGEQQETFFAGNEAWLSENIFQDLKASETWPKVVAITENGADPGEEEKALPHYSVCFTKRLVPYSGKLRIRWAVFLPIGNEPFDEISIPGMKCDITMILHGYFFLNSDRTNIDGIEHDFQNPDGVYRKWNSRLALQGTIREILPTLENFVRQSHLKPKDIQDLTNAIMQSRIYHNFKNHLCAEYQWAFLLSQTGGEWKCISSKDKIHGIPLPSNGDIALAFHVFPNLSAVAEKYNITFLDQDRKSFPRISTNEIQNWSQEMRNDIFSGISIHNVDSNEAALYLLQFIKNLNLTTPTISQIFQLIEDIPLFRGNSLNAGTHRRYSLKELKGFLLHHAFFYETGDSKVIKQLQHVCRELEIVVLSSTDVLASDILSSLLDIPFVDAESLSKTINDTTISGSIDDRTSLINFILKDVIDSPLYSLQKSAVRYLLHGEHAHKESGEYLYLPSLSKDNETWEHVIEIVLDASGQSWRILDRRFEEYLSQYHYRICNIEPISITSACDLLGKTNLSELDFRTLTEGDRKHILLDIENIELLKALPIYPQVGGGLVALSETCYLESDFKPEGELREKWTHLLETAIVIKRFQYPLSLERQKHLIPELDWYAALRLSLCAYNPQDYARVIMEGLSRLGSPRQEIWTLLRDTAWLPIRFGGMCAPKDVIHIEGAQEEVHRLLREKTDGLCGILAFEEWLLDHKGLNTLKQIFPKPKEALDYLSLWLSDKPDMKLGLKNIDSPEELQEFIKILKSVPKDLFPIYPLLDAITKSSINNPLIHCFEHFLPQLYGTINHARFKNILLYLAEQHKSAMPELKKVCKKWFDRYLTAAVEDQLIALILPELQLLNQRGNWKVTSRLTVPSEGISETDQLDKDQAFILHPILYVKKEDCQQQITIEPERIGALPDFEESARMLKKYFSNFEQWVPREMIGAIGVLLGDFLPIKEWAEKMLGYSLDTIRRVMFSDKEIEADVYIKQLEKMRFVVQVIKGKTAEVKAITGDIFQATISENPTSLLFGDGHEMWWALNIPGYDPLFCHKIQFLQIDKMRELPLEDIEKLLQRTAELILYHAHLNRANFPNLQALWKTLRETGQKNILAAQLYLLNAGGFYVRQLGGDRYPTLKENLQKWDRSRQFEAEGETFSNQRNITLEKAQNLKTKAREELRSLLLHDDEVHNFLVNAVREKLRSYQYDISSIPFELFQNADDAYQELNILGCPLDDEHPMFVVAMNENHIMFAHWGRLINEYYRSGFSDVGKNYGFDRDLEKMLTLSFSEKNISNNLQNAVEVENVTGKFGLGFKSVFFATTSPRILSGRFAFQIRGGFYPQQLDKQQETSLMGKLAEWQANLQNNGTIIDLPLMNQTDDWYSLVLRRFAKLITFLLIFSRQIKSCRLLTNETSSNYIWKEDVLPGTACCYYGENPLDGKILLILKSSKENDRINKCSILFQTGIRGFEKIDSDIPSVWITAPTQEKTGCGFVINGPFEPDVGRSRLALNIQANKSIADGLGRSVGNILIELFRATKQRWEDISFKLRLAHDTAFTTFWTSLWEIVSSDSLLLAKKEQEGSAADLTYAIVWRNEDCGYWKLINSCHALPTKLWGDYYNLIALSEIKYYSSGLLDSETIFLGVSKWESFQEKVPPSTIISGSKVYSLLYRLVDRSYVDQWSRLTLSEVIENEIGVMLEISPESANRIGKFINKGFYQNFILGDLGDSNERSQLQDLFSKIHFKSRTGDFRSAKELIVSHRIIEQVSEDEVLRAGFAPLKFILSDEYSKSGIEFFTICREKLSAPADIMTMWAKEAFDRGQLITVFNYLMNGELRYELANKLGRTWLESMIPTEEFNALNDGEQSELKWLFRAYEIPKEAATVPQKTKQVATLEQIYQWWSANKSSLIKQYEAEIFPNQESLKFTIQDIYDVQTNIETRKKWILLFMHGCFYTMGRTTAGQNKNFLDMFIRKGWLNRLANPQQSPDSIISILDEYLEDPLARSEYYQWMKQFISFYQSSKWLEAYVFSLVEIAKFKEKFALDSVFNIRRSPDLTGSGLDAPPLDRGMGIGACFVIRELLRCGFLKNQIAYEHAYVPRKGIRSLISELGCIFSGDESKAVMSKQIYFFLKEGLGPNKAHFDNCFDIPFAMIAQHPELLHEIPELHTQLVTEPIEYYEDD